MPEALERDLYRTLVEISTDPVPESLLGRALPFLVGVTGAREAYVQLGPPSAHTTWSLAAGCDDARVEAIRAFVSRGIIAEAMTSGETVLTASAWEDPRFKDLASVKEQSIAAVLCVPIGAAPAFGVVYLCRELDSVPVFTPEQVRQVELFARVLAPTAELVTRRHELAQTEAEDPFAPVVRVSTAMRELVRKLAWVASKEVRVMLTGPSGAGKTLLARSIHAASSRANGPFVELNCAAIPDSLMENELFGHLPGAYSSATKTGRRGHVEAAHGGTLFLDEVGELSLQSQAKLLQFLDSGTYMRLGSTVPSRADVRVITATNVDLERAVGEGKFREDLLFRLQVFVGRVPPLAERKDDVAPLARRACRTLGEELNVDVRGLGPDALAAIQANEWRGNVRQLHNVVRRGLLMAALRGAPFVEARDLFENAVDPENAVTLSAATDRFQRDHVRFALDANGWNVSEAATQLGVARSYLYTLMKTHGLRRP